jgi:hypothetical protein
MSARLLNLPTDCLSSPTRAHLAIIEAEMVWPDDPAARDAFLQTVSAEILRGAAGDLEREDLITLVHLQSSAPRLIDLQAISSKRVINGAQAGMYLRETLGLLSLGRPAKMKPIAQQITRSLPGFKATNAHTFENHVWPKFRRVAHFWAASLHINAGKPNKANRLPCACSDLPQFLALAEGFKHMGETTRAKQARRPILNSDETVTLPAELRDRLRPVLLPVF